MKRSISILMSLIAVSYLTLSAQSPIGLWVNFHPDKGTPLSQIEFFGEGNMVHAKVHKILDQDINPLCSECKGNLKNEKLTDMTVIWDLIPKSRTQFKNGRILDPESGKIYRCIIELEGENKLKVHGYLGCKFIGKSQYFTRVNSPDELLALNNLEP